MSTIKKILIIDDDPETVGLIELTLKPAGFDIVRAFNGPEAFALLTDNTFDLVLLDVMMPEVSGFDLLRQLQESNTPIPPIIILSARGRTEDIQEGNALGASSYLVKPATRGQLLDAINAALYEGADPDAPD
jgi:DNA-binding response OmpR family regulator